MKSILKLFLVFSASLFLIIAVVVNSDRALADGLVAGCPACMVVQDCDFRDPAFSHPY